MQTKEEIIDVLEKIVLIQRDGGDLSISALRMASVTLKC